MAVPCRPTSTASIPCTCGRRHLAKFISSKAAARSAGRGSWVPCRYTPPSPMRSSPRAASAFAACRCLALDCPLLENMTRFIINGREITVTADPDTPLLWIIREQLGLTGTKYGCGVALCGACTVHVDGNAVRSCSFPLSAAEGRRITTIEGLSNDRSHPVQRAWIAEQVPQCGYCQSGMIMAAVALLAANRHPSDADIDAAITNICRCGTYERIRNAVHRSASSLEAA